MLDPGSLSRERHGRQVKGPRRLVGLRKMLGVGRDLLVGGPAKLIEDPTRLALVEEPGAEPGTIEPSQSAEIHAARRQRRQHFARVIAPHHAHHTDASAPQRRPERGVEHRAAGFPHARPAIGVHHVVDEKVAGQHQIDGHLHLARTRSLNACASASTRIGSTGFDHTPSSLTAEPTMKPSAPVKRIRLSGVTPEPTRVGIATTSLTALTSAGSVSRPVAEPVTITPSARKNSAARAVSTSSMSAVKACEECFFLMSAKIPTVSAPMARR